MDRLVGLTTTMRQTERDLLAIRTRAADERAALTRNLLLVGWPTLALLFAGAGWIVLRSVNRPIADLLDAVGRLGGGDREARVLVEGRTLEFQRLSRAYNDMADNLATAIDRHAAAEQEIARANAELSRRGHPRAFEDIDAAEHSLVAVEIYRDILLRRDQAECGQIGLQLASPPPRGPVADYLCRMRPRQRHLDRQVRPCLHEQETSVVGLS